MIQECQYKNFVSKSEGTQNLHLMHVYKKKLYATDGHRAFVRPVDLPDGVYNLNFQRLADLKPYPKIGEVIPSASRKEIEIKTTIPKMFGSLRVSKQTQAIQLYLTGNGVWTFEPVSQTEISFNPVYFAELAGQEITIGIDFQSPMLSPAVVRFEDKSLMVVMPMRFNKVET